MDNRADYARKLASYINESGSFRCRTVVLNNAAEIADYVQSGASCRILASADLEKEVLAAVGSRNLPIFWLCEEKEDRRAGDIFRYQPASSVMRRIAPRENMDKRIFVMSLFSPSGGSWMEELSVNVATELAKTRRVLLLSLLPFGLPQNRGEEGMSEVLFYLRSGRENYVDYLLRRERQENPRIISPVRWSVDLSRITEEDVENLTEGAAESEGFDLVIFAVGSMNRAGHSAILASDAIFLARPEDSAGNTLSEEFVRQLRESGDNHALLRLNEFPAPGATEESERMSVALRIAGRGEELLGGNGTISAENDASSFGYFNRAVRRAGIRTD